MGVADRLTKLALCTVDCGGAWANTLSSLPHVNIPEDPKGIIPIVPLSRFFFHLEKKVRGELRYSRRRPTGNGRGSFTGCWECQF